MELTAEYLEQVRTASEKAFPFIERCGLEVVKVEVGFCHARLPLKDNQNHIGTMYAGALFTLAEFPGGVIYLTSFDTRHFYPVLKSLNMRFRRPATGVIEVEARLSADEATRIQADAVQNGKCDFGWALELKDASGQVVAVADCLYQLRQLGS